MVPIISTVKNGNIVCLSADENIVVADIQGITETDAYINTSQRIDGRGEIASSAGLRARNIVMTVYLKNDVKEGRELLYDQFPCGDNIKLIVSSYDESLSIDGHVESVKGDLFKERQAIQISIICPFPLFKLYNTETQQEIYIATRILGGQPTPVRRTPYTSGCEFMIVSSTPFSVVAISYKNKTLQTGLSSGGVQSLSIKSYYNDKRIVGHPIDDVVPGSEWISFVGGVSDVTVSIYKVIDGLREEFTAAEYEATTIWTKEPECKGGI